ncbi:GAF domain-containing protein, partial [bacterium]|nr:GAF domain-containing protein [bacterium]
MNAKIADLIEENKDVIVSRWLQHTFSGKYPNYAIRPKAELTASFHEAVLTFSETLRTHKFNRLDSYLKSVIQTRLQMGFRVDEISDILMMFRRLVLEIFFEKTDWQGDDLREGLLSLDTINSRMVSLVFRFITDVMSQKLQNNLSELHSYQKKLKFQRNELEKRVREISALMDSIKKIVSTLELEAVLEHIIVQSCDLTDAPLGLIFEIDETAQELHLRLTDTLSSQIDIPQANQLAKEISSRFTTSQHPFFISNVAVAPPDAQGNKLVSVMQTLTLQAVLAAPLYLKNDLLGGIAVFQNFAHDFSKEDENLLASLSMHAVLAIQNARLYKKSRQAAVLEERNRLAREIHDNLAQGLTALILQLEIIDRLLIKNPERIPEELERSKAQARKNLQEARRSVWDLRAGADEPATLPESIKTEISKLSLFSNVKIHFDFLGSYFDILYEA